MLNLPNRPWPFWIAVEGNQYNLIKVCYYLQQFEFTIRIIKLKWLSYSIVKVVNFGSLFLRSFLQKIRKILLNAVLTPQESLKNFVLKKTEKERGEKDKKHVDGFW